MLSEWVIKAKSLCFETPLIAMETGWELLSESHSMQQKTQSINRADILFIENAPYYNVQMLNLLLH